MDDDNSAVDKSQSSSSLACSIRSLYEEYAFFDDLCSDGDVDNDDDIVFDVEGDDDVVVVVVDDEDNEDEVGEKSLGIKNS